MNCSESQKLLSAFHDGELLPEASAEVAAHLATCSKCSADLELFRALSSMTRRLTDPPALVGDWERLNAKLTASGKGEYRLGDAAKRLLAIAAVLLVLTGAGFIAYNTWHANHDHSRLAQVFGSFLDRFGDQPEAAQRILLANYRGESTTLHEASGALGYSPVIAKGLPPDCEEHEAYLLDMPCCKCMEIVCKQADGHAIAVFEHDTERPGWFGDRNSIECRCHSVPTNVIQVGNELAATWKNGKRYLTLIGARDLNEVAEFVAFYSGFAREDS